MIDCLSNPSWIQPQVDFLLFLQNIRTSHLDIFEKIFLSITVFGEFWLPTLVCAIIYWCIDFRSGIYMFSLEGFNIFLTHLFKMIACVYRPWVLDNRVQPSAVAYSFAKGYSFPSGHSAMSSSIFGGAAFLYRHRKILCISLICLILLIGFSRMWLGVHTPQDVFCGFLIGVILIFALNPVIKWAEKNKKRYLYLLIAINVIAVLALLFVYYLNSYRMDYVSGEILVNPQTQKYGVAIFYAYAAGLINGCYLCRYFCPFNPKEIPVKKRIITGIIGALAIILFIRPIVLYLIINITNTKIAMLAMFLSGLFVTLIYPMIFTKFSKSNQISIL